MLKSLSVQGPAIKSRVSGPLGNSTCNCEGRKWPYDFTFFPAEHYKLPTLSSTPLVCVGYFQRASLCSFRTTALLMCTGHHVDLHNFSEEQNLASFSLTGHLYSFQELAIQGLCTFLNLIVYFLVIDLQKSSYLLTPNQIDDIQIFSPMSWIDLLFG